MADEAQASVRIVPDVSGFESALRAQLAPILARTEGELTRRLAPALGQAGTAAGNEFGRRFSQQASGLIVPSDLSKNIEASVRATDIGGAIKGASSRVSGQVQQAGVVSGRTFGTGFGEGFAALAAFAIARRVIGFVGETAQISNQFETAFAGARRVIEGSAEEFNTLRDSILQMSERLPFAASGIADVAAELGRLGVPLQNIESASEVVLKFSTITSQAPEKVATSFAKFATVTHTPLTELEHLSDVVLKLGTAFAANEEEVLKFSQRLAPLASLTAATGEDVLALATGIVQAGGRAESGGTAIVRTFDLIQQAATKGGAKALEFAKVVGVDSVEAFQRLVQTDPTEAFVRFLEGIRSAGADSGAVLKELGLGAQRSGVQIRALAASADAVRDALDKSKDAAGETERQFNIFASTPAARLKVLQNELTNTRIKMGGVISAGAIPLFSIITKLDTATVSLVTAFAGLASAGFVFVRARAILGTFQKALGGAALSGEQLTFAMNLANQQGLSLTETLAVLRQSNLTVADAQLLDAKSSEALALAFAKQETQALGLIGSFKAVRAANPSAGFFEIARGAVAASGGFGALVTAAGKLSIAVLAADLVSQGINKIQRSLDDLGRGKEDIEGVTLALLNLEAGTGDIDTVFEKARVEFSNLASFAQSVSAGLGESGFGGLLFNPTAITNFARAIQGTGIPVISQLAGAIATVESTALDAANSIPLLGRVITTESENAVKQLADLNQGLLDLFQKSPAAARATAEIAIKALRDQGVAQSDIDKGLGGFIKKSTDAAKSQDFLKRNSDNLIASLRAQGLSEQEVAEQAQAMGLSFEGANAGLGALVGSSQAATAALQQLQSAQQAFTQRVQSLILPLTGVQQLFAKEGKAAGKAGKDTRSSARAIADAEKALARARDEASERLADARRDLADAEEDAARRIIDAQRRIEASRLDARRSLRDAQEELQDFQAALDKVGGPRTEEDFIRLRELQEALADATEDAAIKERDNQEALVEAREEGADRIAEAQRKLAEVEEDNAEKIADALERLARAHEDAAARSSNAASQAAKTIILSSSQITKAFRDQATKLNAFASGIETIRDKVFAAFGDTDVTEAFLQSLVDAGPEALGTIQNIAKLGVKGLDPLVKGFGDQIKAAKRAADLQFKRFPSNFRSALKPAMDTIATQIEQGVDAFDSLADKGGELAVSIGQNTDDMAKQFIVLASQADGSLTSVERKEIDIARRFFEMAASTQDPIEKVADLKHGIDALHGKDLDILMKILANVKVSGQIKELNQLLEGITNPQLRKEIVAEQRNTVFGQLTLASAERSALASAIGGAVVAASKSSAVRVIGGHAQFGATFKAAQSGANGSGPFLVGEAGQELFWPNQGGAVFKHTDSERILRALRMSRTGGGNVINVYEVAQDPRATARAVSFRIGSNGAIR